MVLVDSVVRHLPGVLGDADSAEQDSFSHRRLDHAHYTRPPEFQGRVVPDVLLSGNHAQIERWRRDQALMRTYQRRPDLLKRVELSKKDKQFLEMLEKAEPPEEDKDSLPAAED